MAFTIIVKEKTLVAAARHCSVCHKPKGLNIEVHHIKPKAQGGDDSEANAIALCFDCHSDAGHYFAGHPKGSKLNPSELLKHKLNWESIVREHKIEAQTDQQIEVIIRNPELDPSFQPIYIQLKTIYKDELKLRSFDFNDFIKRFESGNPIIDNFYRKMNSFDDFIKFFNDDYYEMTTLDKCNNIQPITFVGPIFSPYHEKKINRSVCSFQLELINHGPIVLEDFKLYFEFENIIKVDIVDKGTSQLDFSKYRYTTYMENNSKGYFIPENNILVQSDSVKTDTICFLSSPEIRECFINWRLVARNYSNKGILILDINPSIEIIESAKYVVDPEKREIPADVLICKYEIERE